MGLEIILKMLLAAVLGGIIGLEREISHKEAGLRVNVLIAMSSALITVLAFGLAEDSKTTTPSLILAHIITALGLIGAGIVIRERFTAQGLTTAATVWSVGAIGIAVGTGYYLTAFAAAVFIVIGLILLRIITAVLEKQGRVFVYIISSEDRASVIVDIKEVVTELGLKYISANIRKAKEGYEIEMAVHTSQTKNKSFVERVMQIPDVKKITSENL
jgi:putative Mg2+ transporter-C (MgtC) family protein